MENRWREQRRLGEERVDSVRGERVGSGEGKGWMVCKGLILYLCEDMSGSCSFGSDEVIPASDSLSPLHLIAGRFRAPLSIEGTEG